MIALSDSYQKPTRNGDDLSQLTEQGSSVVCIAVKNDEQEGTMEGGKLIRVSLIKSIARVKNERVKNKCPDD